MSRLTERIGEYVQCNDRDCRLSYCDRSCGQYELMVQKLADYEDKQEQGLLIELKVPLGTRIWYIEEDYHDNTVEISTTFYDFKWLYCHKDEEFYLARSEAEEALVKMGGKA